jgi:pyruvate-formate lyase-activating enzyme
MVVVAISAFLDDANIPPDGIVVTQVFPGGCSFSCPFCVVERRGERRLTSSLSPDAYADLVHSLGKRGLLGGAAVVGDEPLQASAWPYVRRYIEAANVYGVPTALITNGYELNEFIPHLRRLDISQLIVSVDAIGQRHDSIRRKVGAFAAIKRGLLQASGDHLLGDRLVIGTILMPGNAADVRNVIRFAATHGIKRIALSPLLIVTPASPLRVHPRVLEVGKSLIPEFRSLAASLGVDLFMADDFHALGDWADALRAAGVPVKAPSRAARLLRVDAGGNISTYREIQLGLPPSQTLPLSGPGIEGLAASCLSDCPDQFVSAA